MAKGDRSIRFNQWAWNRPIAYMGKGFPKFVNRVIREAWEREGHEERYQEWLKRKGDKEPFDWAVQMEDITKGGSHE